VTRLLLLVTDLQRGGTPMRVCRWAAWLREAGWDAIVGCIAPRGPLSAELDRAGIPNFDCGAAHRFDVTALFRLARRLRELQPAILHSFLFHANLAARLVGRQDCRRALITSTATIEIERHCHRRVESLLARRSDAHVCNARRVADHVIRDLHFPPDSVVVIPNGIDCAAVDRVPAVDRAAYGLPNDLPLVLWAGRMDPVKDLETWMRVFEHVRETHPICGAWLGEGPTRLRWEQCLRSADLLAPPDDPALAVGRIRLLGWSDQVIGWLKSASVLMLTSRTEGNPNVLLEAMAARCPVIASDVGSCREHLDAEQRRGWLCPPGEWGAFADALAHAVERADRQVTLVQEARAHVERAESREVVVDRLNRLYRTILTPEKVC